MYIWNFIQVRVRWHIRNMHSWFFDDFLFMQKTVASLLEHRWICLTCIRGAHISTVMTKAYSSNKEMLGVCCLKKPKGQWAYAQMPFLGKIQPNPNMALPAASAKICGPWLFWEIKCRNLTSLWIRKSGLDKNFFHMRRSCWAPLSKQIL